MTPGRGPTGPVAGGLLIRTCPNRPASFCVGGPDGRQIRREARVRTMRENRAAVGLAAPQDRAAAPEEAAAVETTSDAGSSRNVIAIVEEAVACAGGRHIAATRRAVPGTPTSSNSSTSSEADVGGVLRKGVRVRRNEIRSATAPTRTTSGRSTAADATYPRFV